MPIKSINSPKDAGSKPATSGRTPSTPEGKRLQISKMGAGDGFHFTSGRKPANTGHYIKTDSPNNKAMNLNTFGIIRFDKYDEGVPVDLEVGLKRK